MTSLEKKVKKLYTLNDRQASKAAKSLRVLHGYGILDFVQKGLNTLYTKLNDAANKSGACKGKDPKLDYKPLPGENHAIFMKDGCVFRGRFAGQKLGWLKYGIQYPC